MHTRPEAFHRIPDCFKTQELCIKTVEADPSNLGNVPDYFQTQEMCDKVLEEEPSSLIYVTNWFVKQQQVNMWYDDYEEIIGWHNGCQKRKTQKAQMKK